MTVYDVNAYAEEGKRLKRLPLPALLYIILLHSGQDLEVSFASYYTPFLVIILFLRMSILVLQLS